MRLTFAVGFFVSLCGTSLAFATEADWRLLHHEHGVSVWQRDLPGTNTAQFRARAIMQAPAIAITAVIFDTEHTRDWNRNCKANYLLYMEGPGHAITYNRSGSPAFFLSDRDLVVDYRISIDAATKTVRTEFKNVNLPQMPPIAGVVRMPRVEGAYVVHELDSVNTEVVYDITADPGGMVPSWIADWVSRSLIGKVMEQLATQAHQPMYERGITRLHETLDWQGFSPPLLSSNR